eukprot:PhM_4_TR15008/c0_g1_i1/m.3535
MTASLLSIPWHEMLVADLSREAKERTGQQQQNIAAAKRGAQQPQNQNQQKHTPASALASLHRDVQAHFAGSDSIPLWLEPAAAQAASAAAGHTSVPGIMPSSSASASLAPSFVAAAPRRDGRRAAAESSGSRSVSMSYPTGPGFALSFDESQPRDSVGSFMGMPTQRPHTMFSMDRGSEHTDAADTDIFVDGNFQELDFFSSQPRAPSVGQASVVSARSVTSYPTSTNPMFSALPSYHAPSLSGVGSGADASMPMPSRRPAPMAMSMSPPPLGFGVGAPASTYAHGAPSVSMGRVTAELMAAGSRLSYGSVPPMRMASVESVTTTSTAAPSNSGMGALGDS